MEMAMEDDDLTCALCGRRVPRQDTTHVCDGALTGDLGNVMLLTDEMARRCPDCGKLHACGQPHPCHPRRPE